MTLRMRDLAPDQRPRERLFAGQGEGLGDAELLALLWGVGGPGRSALVLAQQVLAEAGGLAPLLALGLSDWTAAPGLGPAKAGQLWAALELARRGQGGAVRPRMTSPGAVAAYLMPRCRDWTEERFGLLALDARGSLLADRILSRGTSIATLISPREFFREALRFGAVAAVAYHNHPSGRPEPSPQDRVLTRRLRSAGGTLGVPLADHLVIGRDGWHSFRAAEGWSA